VRLRGVNRSGGEYGCVEGKPFFDGPVDDPSLDAIARWGANVVRLPLNEDCWLGIRGTGSSEAYRSAVADLAQRFHARGMYVILDLHWSAPEPARATKQAPMPDVDHAVDFWASVARHFKGDPAILFDLFNEPFGVDWTCWRDGCEGNVGMQRLVTVVRSTGARQPILLGGLRYANDATGWLANAPSDPLGQLIAAVHVYDDGACSDERCWDREWASVAARVPLVAAELGAKNDVVPFLEGFIRWADARGVSYLGWTWNPWPGIALIRDWSGTPTEVGAVIKAHFAK
jgi:hypothetical protein